MKAYITCPVSITHQRILLLPELKDLLKQFEIESYIYNISGKPEDVYRHDMNILQESDLLVVEVSEPSHGVGILIGLSFQFGIKRILLIKKGRSLSKILYGMPDTDILEYETKDDLKIKLQNLLSTLSKVE